MERNIFLDNRGIGFETIFLIALGVIAVIFIVAFQSGFFKDIGEIKETIPQAVTIRADQFCNDYAEAKNDGGYCSEFPEFSVAGGDKEYMNCNYIKSKYKIENLKMIEGGCPNQREQVMETCSDIGKPEAIVNGLVCGEVLTCKNLGGEWQEAINGKCFFTNDQGSVDIEGALDEPPANLNLQNPVCCAI